MEKCWDKGGSQEGQYPEWFKGRRDTHAVKSVTNTHIVWTYGHIGQPDIWFADLGVMLNLSPIQEDFMTYQEYDKCQDINTFVKNTVKGIGDS